MQECIAKHISLQQTELQYRRERDAAQELYNMAIDATDRDDVSADDRAKVTRASAALEDAQRSYETAIQDVKSAKELVSKAKERQRRKERYSHAHTQEYSKLFPRDHYEALIRTCTTEVELKDVQTFSKLILLSESRSRRGSNKDVAEYSKMRHPSVRQCSKEFFPSAAEIGRALLTGSVSHARTPAMDPASLFARYVCEEFPTETEVEIAVRKVLCTELAAEPSVRKSVRDHYRHNATLSTEPTKKGIEVITPFHELFGLHKLDRKPIIELLNPPSKESMFVGGSNRTVFARLVRAQKEGLLEIKLNPPNADQRLLMTLPPSFGVSFQNQWNQLRASILSEVNTLLQPYLKADIYRELLRVSKEAIIEEAADKYAELVNTGPYRPPAVKFAEVVANCPFKAATPTVLSIFLPTSAGKDSAIYMAFVDKDGLIRAQVNIPHEARNKRREKISKFLKSTRPDVIAINSGAGFQSVSMQGMIEKFLVPEVRKQLEDEVDARRRDRRDRHDYGRYDDDDDEDIRFEPNVSAE